MRLLNCSVDFNQLVVHIKFLSLQHLLNFLYEIQRLHPTRVKILFRRINNYCLPGCGGLLLFECYLIRISINCPFLLFRFFSLNEGVLLFIFRVIGFWLLFFFKFILILKHHINVFSILSILWLHFFMLLLSRLLWLIQ